MKHTKHFLAALLIICMIPVLATPAFAEETRTVVDSGFCGAQGEI